MPIRLRVEHGPHEGLSHREVLRRARAMFATLQLGKSEISIVLTNDEQIQQLNKLYRHLDKPTDVLAFAMQEGEAARLHAHILGDVVVSVETARRQARRVRRRVLSEATMLIAHGILHLLGWDHETLAKDRRMRAETARLCRAAGRTTRGARPRPEQRPRAVRESPLPPKRAKPESDGRL